MNKIYPLFALFLMMAFCLLRTPAQTTIAGWNFDDSNLTVDVNTAANNGATIGTNSTGTVTYSAGVTGNSASNTGWNSGSGTRNWFTSAISTTGFETLTISSVQRSSNTGPRDFKIQYSLDNSVWTDVVGGAIVVANDFISGVVSNLALPSACDNQPTVYLRWIMTSNTSANGGTVASTGTSRFEDVFLVGEAIPSGPVCNISAISFQNVSACNDNGTPANPADDTFTADVVVSFSDAPITGTLDLSGDATASVAVGSLGSATSYTFSGITFPANGTNLSVTAAFSDDVACTFTNNALPGVASCSAASCALSIASFTATSACNDGGTPLDPADDTFEASLEVSFSNIPATGNLVLSGDASASVPVASLIGGTYTFTNMVFPANGANVSVIVTFSDDVACTNNGSFAGVASCSAPPAPCLSESFANVPTTNSSSYQTRNWTGDNGTSFSATDARTDQVINGSTILIRNAGALTTSSIPGGIGDLTLTTRRFFAGGSGTLSVTVNGAPVGTIPYSDVATTSTITGINVTGNVIVVIGSISGAGDRVALDDLQWSCYSVTTPCTEPLAQPTALTFPTITSTQVDGSFTASGSADSYLVIRSNDATLDASPVDATTYAPGQSLAPGDTVVSFGTATTFSATGLASGTGYTFFVIAANSACVGGPDYPTASPLSGLATTVPAAPTAFTTTCATGSSITVSWALPSGVYDGVLLVVRESATLSPHSVASLNPVIQAFDTDYSLAPTYGGTAPESRVVYKGTGTSATITGLTAGQTYRFQIYAYSGTTYSDAGANGPQTTRVAEINEASNFVAGSQNASATFSWNNPISGCFDDVLVVVSANPIATVPTATSYGANTIFGLGDELAVASGEFVVYQGTGTNVEVTGLTNGTLYYARVFVRVGAAWSAGVSATVTPLATTELQLGDIAVIAVNANDVGCAGVSASDEIYFVAFVDIATGTSLDITDNGWEHTTAGQFGDSEGIWRFTYTGATIPAGTIFSIKIRSGISNTNSANPDWIASDINGSGISAVALNNSGDQFFVMQGGVWTNPAGANNATYDGKFLFGFNTATTWASAGSTTTSNLHPAVECANIAAASSTEQLYYNGPVTTASALDWFNRLRTPANWAAASDCANFATALTTNFPTNSIAIDGSVPTVATWTGAVDDNWFNCQNWDINRVPGENADVVIPAAATVNCEIDATAPFAVNFGSANARNLNVEATAVSLILENSSNDILNVAGNLTLADGATLDMNGNAGTTGGTLFLSGNWINNSTTDAVDEGSASTVHFSGTTAQTLSNAAGEQALANVVMNNLAGLTLNAPLAVNAALTFTQGILTSTTTNPLRVGAAGSVSGQSNGSHVNGPVAKTGNTAFDFPIGNGTALRSLRIAAGGAASDEFTARYFGNNPAPVVGAALAPDVAFISVNEYWSLNPASGTPNRIVTLTWNPASGVVSASDVLVVYYTGLAWTQMGGNGNAGGFTGNAANGTVTASDANTFGFLTLGAPTAFLPIELLSLTAQPVGGQIHLDWATSREENAAFFAVERSQDGNNFEEIGNVAAAGNSQVVRKYDFVDVQALRGESFYRLRMVDLDGTMQYSAAVKAFLGESNQLVVNGLYPNPAGQQVFAEVAAQTTAPVSVRVLTVEGKLVSTQAFESVTGVTTLQIELGQLPQGVYLLEFTQNGIRTVERVVKR